MLTRSKMIARSYLMTAIGTFTIGMAAPQQGQTESFDPVAGSDLPNHSGVVESIEGSATPYATANQLELAADYCVTNHNYDQAIDLCKRALMADDNDLDIHKSYAQALEGKWRAEHSHDANLFNACLREWLIVMRTERGEEKLPSFHGITVPGYGHLYRDEDYEMEARMHLRQLTGSTPKAWETDAAYLKRAGQETTSTVTGKILTPGAGAPTKPTSKPAAQPTEQDHSLDWLNH